MIVCQWQSLAGCQCTAGCQWCSRSTGIMALCPGRSQGPSLRLLADSGSESETRRMRTASASATGSGGSASGTGHHPSHHWRPLLACATGSASISPPTRTSTLTFSVTQKIYTGMCQCLHFSAHYSSTVPSISSISRPVGHCLRSPSSLVGTQSNNAVTAR
jgi:hypothetical protein